MISTTDSVPKSVGIIRHLSSALFKTGNVVMSQQSSAQQNITNSSITDVNGYYGLACIFLNGEVPKE